MSFLLSRMSIVFKLYRPPCDVRQEALFVLYHTSNYPPCKNVVSAGFEDLRLKTEAFSSRPEAKCHGNHPRSASCHSSNLVGHFVASFFQTDTKDFGPIAHGQFELLAVRPKVLVRGR